MRKGRLSFPYRPPYDWDALMAFLAARATPGVELVDRSSYRRTIEIKGLTGTIQVRQSGAKPAIDLEVRFPHSRALPVIVERVRRMFDLEANPLVIAKHLAGDALIGGILQRHPGIRTPGAWDGFELAVRAILGQQVSVAAATTMAGRLAARFGAPVDTTDGLDRTFPVAAQLLNAPIEELGVISARAETIRTLARAVTAGTVSLTATSDFNRVMKALQALRGIGPWTAQYIAMRGLGDTDAFPRGDLVLRRMAGDCTSRELDHQSERWRPWRSYAVMLLWQAATDTKVSRCFTVDDTARLSPRSAHARGDRGGTGRRQEHARSATRRPVPQRVVRRR